MPPWAAHGVVSWAESTWVLLHRGVSGWRNQGGGGAGTAQPSHKDTSVRLGRRMLRLCAPLLRPYATAIFATKWRDGFGQHEHSGTVHYHSQLIAFKGQGVWLWFVGWDLAAVAGPYFGTCPLYISACPGTSLPTDPQE